ncbi:TetR/AcrR family transcriptional regulator [Nocardia terpenica]
MTASAKARRPAPVGTGGAITSARIGPTPTHDRHLLESVRNTLFQRCGTSCTTNRCGARCSRKVPTERSDEVEEIRARIEKDAPVRGPDPRAVRSRQAALTAAQELLAEQGWTGVTHVAVAARSGVGRTTLYRHWPDVAALVQDAIVQRMDQVRPEPTGELRADLISELNGLRRLLHDPVGQHGMRAVLDRAPFDPAFGTLKTLLHQAGSAGFRAILEAAEARGELRPDTDIDFVIEQLVGPLIFRRLLAELDIDDGRVQSVVDAVLRLYATD